MRGLRWVGLCPATSIPSHCERLRDFQERRSVTYARLHKAELITLTNTSGRMDHIIPVIFG